MLVLLCAFVSMTTFVDATNSSCVTIVASSKHTHTRTHTHTHTHTQKHAYYRGPECPSTTKTVTFDVYVMDSYIVL